MDGDVEVVDVCEGDGEDCHGPEGVEENLAGAEEGLAQDAVQKDSFKTGGQIGIQPLDTERLVVNKMIRPKARTVRDSNRQVRKDCQNPVVKRLPECKVMRDLMDGEEEVLVRCCADDIGREEEWPREEGLVAEGVDGRELDRDDEEDGPFCEGLGAAELGDLRVGFNDLVTAGAVWFLLICLEEC